jgi:hypothetical protein
VSNEQPGSRFEIRQAYTELGTPVEGELRREPVADADVPCPRCGAREWLLIERRAEPHEPFTRWRALACANCGAADGWESAGRARRGRAADREGWDEERVPGMPHQPTLDDVCRLAPFRVLAPGGVAKLRSYSHTGGRLTGVTVASGGVEVTTEIRHQVLNALPVELAPEHRARNRLEHIIDDWREAAREPRSEPVRELRIAAAQRQAAARAAAAPARQAMIDVDGASVAFALVEAEGRWVAAADIDDESVTIAARGIPTMRVTLGSVLRD